mmetsp:Transcript_18899/g.59932  ORF Transcript_18899/g.59932 Transcript_18899/m.59932 type:complete len:269 (+) Transcript_18899:83-889(+)
MGQQCTIPSLARASKEIDMQVDTIERKIQKAEETIRHYVERAASDPVAKQRALQAMKRKKMLEAQRQDLIGAQFNCDSLADQQEQAKFTLRAVEAMKAGHMVLKQDQAKMDVRQVEEMLDATEDIADDMRAISESLARGSDQASLESELLALQREYAPRSAVTAGPQMDVRAALEAEAALPTARPAAAQQPAAPLKSTNSFMEGKLPAPPPPPPPPARTTPNPRADDLKADLWAKSALSAAMAPYGHLDHPGLSPAQPAPFSRTAVAA